MNNSVRHRIVSWGKFTLGLALISGFYYILNTSQPPPGIAGEVLRHNLEQGIDANPLIYSDLDKMMELEEGLRNLLANRDSAENR